MVQIAYEGFIYLIGPAAAHSDLANSHVMHGGNHGFARRVSGDSQGILGILDQLQHPLASQLDRDGYAVQGNTLSATAHQVLDAIGIAAHGVFHALNGVVFDTQDVG